MLDNHCILTTTVFFAVCYVLPNMFQTVWFIKGRFIAVFYSFSYGVR